MSIKVATVQETLNPSAYDGMIIDGTDGLIEFAQTPSLNPPPGNSFPDPAKIASLTITVNDNGVGGTYAPTVVTNGPASTTSVPVKVSVKSTTPNNSMPPLNITIVLNYNPDFGRSPEPNKA